MAGSVEEGCSIVEAALDAAARRKTIDTLARSKDLRAALARLGDGIRAAEQRFAPHDARTRHEGFHVLHDWDGKADRVNADSIPIDVLNYLAAHRGDELPDARVLAILLDYHLLHLLALLSVRVWDDGDADENLGRIQGLLDELQGPGGGGHRFAADAETLILIATSHYEMHERGYDTLLARVRSLGRAHQTRIARGHAASLGCHLRFGFEATYGRDTVVMRNDNVADYPWLCFSLATLMREYVRLAGDAEASDGHDRLVEALLNGLSADARAFVGEPPAMLAGCAAELSEFYALFHEHRDALVEEFERFRPSARRYSPLSFFFNFSHNVVKGAVVDALLRGEPWPVSLDDLLTGVGDERDLPAREQLARTLMGHAREHPDRIRGRLMPVIVYDPQAGMQACSVTLQKIRG